MTQLPEVLAEIAEVAGKDAAWEIARAQGGRVVYIPAKVDDGHWLSELVGQEKAKLICDHFRVGDSGLRILIPLAKFASQRERLARALEQGLTAPDAAQAAGMHVRTAYRARARRRKTGDDDQGDLF